MYVEHNICSFLPYTHFLRLLLTYMSIYVYSVARAFAHLQTSAANLPRRRRGRGSMYIAVYILVVYSICSISSVYPTL